MRCFVEWATVLFVVQLSLGESIWSPRWYDYSMSVAPEGREGVFTAMASAPLFLGKFVTGILLRVLFSELSCYSARCLAMKVCWYASCSWYLPAPASPTILLRLLLLHQSCVCIQHMRLVMKSTPLYLSCGQSTLHVTYVLTRRRYVTSLCMYLSRGYLLS